MEMNDKYFVVVDIGCIECGESSAVLGIFTTNEQAKKVAEEHENRQKEHWAGQHYFAIFEIDEINKEYRQEYHCALDKEDEF